VFAAQARLFEYAQRHQFRALIAIRLPPARPIA
jgi:hypothetical protein